jgi:hypothetical protein
VTPLSQTTLRERDSPSRTTLVKDSDSPSQTTLVKDGDSPSQTTLRFLLAPLRRSRSVATLVRFSLTAPVCG